MENAIPKSMISAFAILALTAAHAAGHEVRLTGMANGEHAAFEPPFLKIAPGDTVTFLPVDNHQRVESVLVPAGATPFQGALDQPFSVTLDAEGIYLYVSPPQQKMNVGGVIQAGR